MLVIDFYLSTIWVSYNLIIPSNNISLRNKKLIWFLHVLLNKRNKKLRSKKKKKSIWLLSQNPVIKRKNNNKECNSYDPNKDLSFFWNMELINRLRLSKRESTFRFGNDVDVKFSIISIVRILPKFQDSGVP